MEKEEKINLKYLFFKDVLAGAAASFLAAPIVKIVDVSVTTTQSGKGNIIGTVRRELSLLKRPSAFFLSKPFGWSWAVYCVTYISNNIVDTICRIKHINDFFPKLILVTSINTIMCLLRDSAFAKYFGVKAPSNVPLYSITSWLVRDLLMISSAFILPSRLAVILVNKGDYSKDNAAVVSQVVCPLTMMFFTLPFNLLGLDFYNNNISTLKSRMLRVFRVYPRAIWLSPIRFGNAYVIGGINNTRFREKLDEYFSQFNYV